MVALYDLDARGMSLALDFISHRCRKRWFTAKYGTYCFIFWLNLNKRDLEISKKITCCHFYYLYYLFEK